MIPQFHTIFIFSYYFHIFITFLGSGPRSRPQGIFLVIFFVTLIAYYCISLGWVWPRSIPQSLKSKSYSRLFLPYTRGAVHPGPAEHYGDLKSFCSQGGWVSLSKIAVWTGGPAQAYTKIWKRYEKIWPGIWQKNDSWGPDLGPEPKNVIKTWKWY